MYSYEERRRAVDLYIKLGKRMGATIRKLGYPTKNSLKKWHQEFLGHGDLHIAYARTKQKYSPAQIAQAVEHYLSNGRCYTTTIQALGYPGRKKLTDWVCERHPEFRRCVVGKMEFPGFSGDLCFAA